MKLHQIFLLVLCFHFSKSDEIDLSKSIVWGPGLEPQNIILPARYIFLQTFALEELPHPIDFLVVGRSLDNQRECRIWSNVLNRKDGSFILRYKMYEPCSYLEIIIKYKSQHLGSSPYVFKEIIYPEICKCQQTNLESWIQQTECGPLPMQIHADLKIFSKINWNLIRDKVIEKYDKPSSVSLCHYIVKDNEVYRKCYGKYVGFNMFMDSILLSMTRKIKLPNLELFINLGDWPLVKHPEIYPIFSWCSSTDTYDIIMPTYDITESTIENMGRVMLDMLSVQGNQRIQWEHRIPKVFWRGRDSNKARLKLIDIARENPNLFNVSMTNFFFYRDQEDKYGPKSPHVSFYNFFDYKYQASIDGTVAAYRFPYLLAGGSLIFKQTSKYYEHFYNDLKPNEHYIPIKEDLSDLVEKIHWIMNNDMKAKAIAEKAKNYANDNLLPKNIYCYHAQLFNEYAKRLESKVEVLEGMMKVEQSEETKRCPCGFKIKEKVVEEKVEHKKVEEKLEYKKVEKKGQKNIERDEL